MTPAMTPGFTGECNMAFSESGENGALIIVTVVSN